MRACDAILKGPLGPPIGDTRVPGGTIERGIILRLRFDLDLYVNLRPFQGKGLDFVVIRENTEGTYAGEGGFLRKGTPHEVATQGSVNTRMGVERCVRYAFDLAQSRPRRHLTLVHKTNVLTFAGDLWQRTFNEVAAEYPDVATAYNHVDAGLHLPRRGPGPLRRDRHRQPLRRHPHRPLAGAVAGGIGLAGLGQPQPGPHRAVDVRAGARLGPRHRRHRQGQPAGRHPVGRHDARLPGRGRRRRPHHQSGRRRVTSLSGTTTEIGDAVAASV